MYATVQLQQLENEVKKRICAVTGTATLKITCKRTNFVFLLDTGSDACTIPYFKKPISEADGKLHCANGSVIHTFGTENLTIDLGLNKTFTFDFIKADIQQPIIGADFLDKYGL